jgi:superfamily I DNA/RNA helicase
MRVLDVPQEQLVRSLGDGHRVIHGVAGSGKTMLLALRAQALASASAPDAKPILILCYSEPLAVKLTAVMQARGLAERVLVRPFYQWCNEQLLAFGQKLPAPNLPLAARMEDLVQRVVRAVDAGTIASGQYQAILIDEGHDFAPEWLRLVTRMVDPATNNLLLLYDDVQSIHERSHTRHFSFRRVGVQAQGRSAILRVNHRNTRQILQTASLIASDLLSEDDDQDDDGIPLLKPVHCGRDGPETVITRLQTFREEAFKMAELLTAAHQDGHAWGDMAIICRHTWMRDECVNVLQLRKLPYETRSATPAAIGTDSIKLLTMQACKGLEFAVVALPGVGHMPAEDANEQEEARLFYIAATRATERLFITVSRTGAFGRRLA